MNILLVVWNLTLGRGGRQRAGAALANEMIRRGHRCTVLVNDERPNPPLFPLDESIGLIHLDTAAHLEYREKLLRHRNDPAFHEAVRARVQAVDPDLVMVMSSSREILMWPLILEGTDIPLVLAERTDPNFMVNLCWETPEERLAVLTAADLVLFQMEGFRAYYPAHLQDRLRVVPNQVAPARRQADPGGRSTDVRTVINVARLDMHKYQPLLARAFGLIAPRFPDWELHFWGGEGVLAEELQAEIDAAGLTGRAFVHPTTADVAAELAKAQIFAFPSEFEGCPNALLEAQAHGLPAIGYRGCGGTNEIIRHGENGLLFDELEPESLARALETLLGDADLRERMGRAATENARRFAPASVFDRFEQAFREAAAHKGRPRRGRPANDGEATSRACLKSLYTRQWI
jgi:glycosyltransferase involved in cell wall biosynthesis